MTEAFRNVGLIAKAGDEQSLSTLQQLMDFLQQKGLNAVLDAALSSTMATAGLQAASRHQMGECCDLVIVVGGDGSLLGAARDLARHDVPVLGVNRGRLGFLTDIMPHDIETGIGAILDGEFEIESRFLLNMEAMRGKAVLGTGSALNDVVLLSGDSVHMIEFELYVDGVFVYNQRSDGLIIATPTGSTAYALSCGGPIMHPKLDAIVLVPMNPHTLTSRPLVIDANSEIKVKLLSHQVSPLVSCDGQPGVRVGEDDWVYVRKKPHRLKLLHPRGHNFYQSCRSKLGWSSRLETR